MECNKDEALRAKQIAEKKFTGNDIAGAKKFALKAQKMFPQLDGIEHLIATIIMALGVDPKPDDESVTRQYRKLVPIGAAEMDKRIAIDEEEALPAVPHHVIYEILSRSPLKTLMRFKCVSKEWLCTIHDPSLAGEFLIHQQSQIHNGATAPILVSFYGDDVSENLYFSLDLELGMATPIVQLNQPEFAQAKILEALMGLTCFELKGLTYFCNLRTKEITPLPPTLPDFPVDSRIQIFTSLGFDPAKKQFKILKTWTFVGPNGNIKSCHKILTLGTTDWRKVDDGLLEIPIGGSVYVNGCLHYLTMDLLCRRIVVAFNVGTEKFQVIELPDGAAVLGYQTKVILYKDHLAVVDSELLSEEGRLYMYVLEDYQNQEWVGKEVFLPASWARAREGMENFHVSGISSGEILISPKVTMLQFYVLLYDVEKSSWEKIEIYGLPHNLIIGPKIVDCPPIEYGVGESILSLKKIYY